MLDGMKATQFYGGADGPKAITDKADDGTTLGMVSEVTMRFPVNATQQKRCPVCKAAGPGTNPPATPRPETACLSFAVWHRAAKGQSGPMVLGGDLSLGWDAGVCKHPKSRTSLGAVVSVAKLQAPRTGEGCIDLQFCSIACLRQFLMAALDELERRAEDIGPQVKAAHARAEVES
jgi:hypothetical protein